jgi:hypothetical protein
MKFRRSKRNYRLRKAVESYPTCIDSRSDNISLLGPNLRRLIPFLTLKRHLIQLLAVRR